MGSKNFLNYCLCVHTCRLIEENALLTTETNDITYNCLNIYTGVVWVAGPNDKAWPQLI